MRKSVLAIGAHPDDIEIGCGGTIAALAARGYEVVHLVISSGEEGGLLSEKRVLALQRESEASASARALGASEVVFFREPDGWTGFSKETKVRLISLLRKLRPGIVFTHAESDHFPDHLITHQLTRSAILAAAGPWYPGAEGVPHQVSSVYGYEVWNPISKYQVAVDISATFERKLEALKLHRSQTETVNYAAAVEGLAKYRGAMAMSGRLAEVFEVLKVGGLE